jgi:hypothetical protein
MITDKGDIVTYTDKLKNQQQVMIVDYNNATRTATVRPEGSINLNDDFTCLQSDLSLEVRK